MTKWITILTITAATAVTVVVGARSMLGADASVTAAALRLHRGGCAPCDESPTHDGSARAPALEAEDWDQLRRIVESDQVRVVFIGCSDLLDAVLSNAPSAILGTEVTVSTEAAVGWADGNVLPEDALPTGDGVASTSEDDGDGDMPEGFGGGGDLPTGADDPLVMGRVLKRIIGHRAEIIEKYAADPLVIRETATANTRLSEMARVRELDAAWIAGGDADWIDAIITSPSSRFLRKKVLSNNLIYTEAFLCDRQGCVIGMYPRTSDYWQGDESKFIDAFNSGAGQTFIGAPAYDESTRSYSVQVSAPVMDQGRAIGVLVMGLRNVK